MPVGRMPYGGHTRFGRRTWHESTFAAWCPDLEPQVTFGTGRGGFRTWGAVSFTADFVDREEMKVYEVDGSSHKGPERQERDRRKDRFFEHLGFDVLRVPNRLIETWAIDALLHVAQWNMGLISEPDQVQVFRARPLIERIERYHAGNRRWAEMVRDSA